MRTTMLDYLNDFTHEDAVKFFKENKDKKQFLSESEEFYIALWDRMLELLKSE